MRFACPECKAELEREGSEGLTCETEQLSFQKVGGIWRLMTETRLGVVQPFLDRYRTVRDSEGRLALRREDLSALPFSPPGGARVLEWQVRAASFECMVTKVVQPMHQRGYDSISALDLGAGNCWLSHRLSGLGVSPIAVDIFDDPVDGLGACDAYPEAITAVQAELDRLPFLRGSVDLVIFNASLHYSTSFETTLAEGLRVLAEGGQIVVMDTPFYRLERLGLRMKKRRAKRFSDRYGFAPNADRDEAFVSPERLERLGRAQDVTIRRHQPKHPAGVRTRMFGPSFPLFVITRR